MTDKATIVVGQAIHINNSIQTDAKRQLGRVIVNLTLQNCDTAEANLVFEGVSSTLEGDQTTEIMAARTQVIYDQAVRDLENKGLTDTEMWRAKGLMKKAESGDLNFHNLPGGPLLFRPPHAVKAGHSGVSKGDLKHVPIVLSTLNNERLDLRIDGYDQKKFMVVVTGDPSMYDRAIDGITAPPFENIFDEDAFIGSNGSVVSGPARLRNPNYVFFKYRVILLESPFVTHDPDVICGSPVI